MREQLERYQVVFYLAAILAGMAIGWASPVQTRQWELLLTPDDPAIHPSRYGRRQGPLSGGRELIEPFYGKLRNSSFTTPLIRMAKNWAIILFAMLMVVQSLSIAAEVLPIHSDHQSHELADISAADDSTQTVDPSPGSDHNTPPGHCHACHCHGSHMLLSMQLPMLPTVASNQTAVPYTVDHPSPPIAAILRPPKA